MIRDITIGQYYPAKSKIHSLDPRVKFIGTIVFIVSMFCFGDTFFGYILTTGYIAAVIALGKLPVKFIFKGLKPILFLLLFTMCFNLLLTPGDVTLVSFGIINISDQGIKMALFMGLRLASLVMGTSLMTFTTTPNQLTDAMERIFAPLKLIKVPVHEMAMMMSIALRFIPILIEETDKIMKAQQARGADFESGNVFARAKSLIPILVPLFVGAFRRAGDLAMAMEARCYNGGEGRTKMKPLKYTSGDFAAYGVIVLYLAAVITLGKIL